jgi:hypothetical protein
VVIKSCSLYVLLLVDCLFVFVTYSLIDAFVCAKQCYTYMGVILCW